MSGRRRATRSYGTRLVFSCARISCTLLRLPVLQQEDGSPLSAGSLVAPWRRLGEHSIT